VPRDVRGTVAVSLGCRILLENTDKVNEVSRLVNGRLSVEIIDPNAESDRLGPRFEWCGMVSQVTLDGAHTFCRRAGGAAIAEGVGLAEETGMLDPLGYGEAAAGEEFVKIGIGVLRKHENQPYGFWKPYPVLRAPAFEVTRGRSEATHSQAVSGPRGWAYEYVKRIVLADDQPVLAITHELRNTGARTIKTSQYNHNFLILDCRLIGPEYRMRLKFRPASKDKTGDRVELEDSTLGYPRPFEGKPLFMQIEGFSTLADNSITVESTATGTGVRIEGDFPLERLHFFTTRDMICPEPFVRLQVEPGQVQRWTRTYAFFAR